MWCCHDSARRALALSRRRTPEERPKFCWISGRLANPQTARTDAYRPLFRQDYVLTNVATLQIEAKKPLAPLETRFFRISIGLPDEARCFRW